MRPEINVYRIKDVQTGKEKVVHRNLLLPVNFLSWDDGEEESVRSDSTGATRGSALSVIPSTQTHTVTLVMTQRLLMRLTSSERCETLLVVT